MISEKANCVNRTSLKGLPKSSIMRVRVIQIDTRDVTFADYNYVYPVDKINTWADIVPRFVESNKLPKFHELTVRYHQKLFRGSNVIKYEFIKTDEGTGDPARHLTWMKIPVLIQEIHRAVNEIDTSWDIMVMLDTDAWVKDVDALVQQVLIPFNSHDDKHVLFAEEPPCEESRSNGINQVLNTGFICMKNTQIALDMMKLIWSVPDLVGSMNGFKQKWAYDQASANYLYAHLDKFKACVELVPLDWCNTPAGKIVRHCWIKELLPVLLAGDMLCLQQQQSKSIKKQKFLFYNPPTKRSCLTTYDNYLNKAGFSGTDGSLLEMSKRLASLGHDVSIVSDMYDQTFTDAHGIRYLFAKDIFMGAYSCDDVDVFLPNFPFFDGIPVEIYNRMNREAIVLPWLHCVMDPEYTVKCSKLLNPTFKLTIVGPSNFALAHVPADVKSCTVPYGINPSLVPELRPQRRVGSWVFPACFARGGGVCVEAFKRTKAISPSSATRLDMMSYYTPDHERKDQQDEAIHAHASLHKKKLFDILSDSDYFVYPLTDADGNVHHDTYACCVLEALACGVIVISWDVACLREVYGDHIILIPPIPYPGYDPTSTHPKPNPLMAGTQGVNRFVKAIAELEASPEIKESIRRKGRDWALQQTWDSAFDALYNHIKTDEL